MIENADSYPVPIVYVHEGHAILCFIDQNFHHRGVELVNITGYIVLRKNCPKFNPIYKKISILIRRRKNYTLCVNL